MADSLFSICNCVVLPAWLLLIAAPRWKGTATIASCVVPLALGLIYVVLIARYLPFAEIRLAHVNELGRLFAQPEVLLAGWLHYLAFDLFVGSWQVRNAMRLGLPHGLVIPCLMLTFLLGPTGLVSYFVLRAAYRGRLSTQKA